MSRISLRVPRKVSRHRHRKKSLERAGSSQSRHGLDWMNFFTADVQTGFGAFVSFYLANLRWSQQDVGFALTLGRLSGVVGLIPAGALTDMIRAKRGLAAAGTLNDCDCSLDTRAASDFRLRVDSGSSSRPYRRHFRTCCRGDKPWPGRQARDVVTRRAKSSIRCGRQCPDRRRHGITGKVFHVEGDFCGGGDPHDSCLDCAWPNSR